MSMLVFDGREFARRKELALAEFISQYNLVPRMASVVFREDAGSMLYTSLKKQTAVRVGVEFSVQEVSIADSVDRICNRIEIYNRRRDLHGVMVQKPMKATWEFFHGKNEEKYKLWWQRVVGEIDPNKDVDCLTQLNLSRVYSGEWWLLPATVSAVLAIIYEIFKQKNWLVDEEFGLRGKQIVVLGRSDIVGRPLAEVLKQYGGEVSLFGTDLDPERLSGADLVVSATGVPGLIKGDMVKEGVVVIDCGVPQGDVDFETIKHKAWCVTPVPGGVGPVTIVSLLENLVDLMVKGEGVKAF